MSDKPVTWADIDAIMSGSRRSVEVASAWAAVDATRSPASLPDGAVADLVEAGLTEAGARLALSWLNSEMDPATAAATGEGLSGEFVRAGLSRGLVREATTKILRRQSSESDTGKGAAVGRAAVEAATARLVAARAALTPRSRFGGTRAQREATVSALATSYADGTVKAITDWAIREGWTQEQIAQRLDQITADMPRIVAEEESQARAIREQRAPTLTPNPGAPVRRAGG